MSWDTLLLCYKRGSAVAATDSEVEEDPLKTPDDIIEAVEKSKHSGDHTEIHTILNDRRINLRSRIEEEGRGNRTILRKLLEDAVNGNKIVEKQLDKDVRQTGTGENCINYGAEIDFEGIFKDGSPMQTRVVKELLDLRAVSPEGEQKVAYTSLITHPVIATFIHLKWRKARWYFYLNSAIFTTFLALYSTFIWRIFKRPEVYCKQLENAKDKPGSVIFQDEDYTNDCLEQRNLFRKEISVKSFLTEWDDGFMICEMHFLILLVFLALIEVYQAMVLRLQYFKELENLIEWVVLLSATVTIVMKEVLVDMNDPKSAWVRGIAALGIGAAWLELIFIIGRYPFRGGDFSIMFYNIIRKTFRYVIASTLMVLGFAFAFMVVNFGIEGESFVNPIKSSVMTLTMVLGEFNFGDMYESFGGDVVSRGFAMIILLFLIILGTITMVNLFVVVIISDISELKKEVFHQSLVNMATYSILVEALLPRAVLTRWRVPETVRVCLHRLCPASCEAKQLGVAKHYSNVKGELREILRKRKEAGAGWRGATSQVMTGSSPSPLISRPSTRQL